MPHQIAGRHLGRNSAQRKALFRGLVTQVLQHERIETTESKAKAVRGDIEKIITLADGGRFPNPSAIDMHPSPSIRPPAYASIGRVFGWIASSEYGCNILDDDESGSKLANDSRELSPQSRARSSQPSTLSSVREILARESTADEIDGLEVVGTNGPHVSKPGSVGPVLFKDFAAELILLNLPFHGA